MTSARERQRYRAVFVSDVHLGTRGCRARELIDFIRVTDADTIYLVGDIVDFWRQKRGIYWPQLHNDVLQKLLRKVRKGARIVYIPGNHDEAMRSCCGMSFGGIDVQRDAVHTTADGKRLWIVHGDEYEAIARYGKWVRFLGDFGYEMLTGSNLLVKWSRRRLGFGYWSLANYLKDRVSGSRAFIAEFEAGLAAEARRRGYDGVVCGHIHYAQDREIDGIRYLNTGDWVDSRTALVESVEGEVRLLRWHDIEAAVRAPEQAPEAEPVLTAA